MSLPGAEAEGLARDGQQIVNQASNCGRDDPNHASPRARPRLATDGLAVTPGVMTVVTLAIVCDPGASGVGVVTLALLVSAVSSGYMSTC